MIINIVSSESKMTNPAARNDSNVVCLILRIINKYVQSLLPTVSSVLSTQSDEYAFYQIKTIFNDDSNNDNN